MESVEWTVAAELPAQPWTMVVCRELVAAALRPVEVPQEVAEDLALAVTEACANAVRHAGSGGPYRLEIRVDEGCFVLDVSDRGPGFDADRMNGQPGLHGGRGLMVIRAVMDEVRFRPRDPGTRITMIKYR